MLYPAEEIVVGRISLDHDRRALCTLIRHEKVHLVPFERRLLLRKPKPHGKSDVLLWPKVVYVTEDVFLCLFEISGYLREVLVLFKEFVRKGVYNVLDDLPVEFVYPVLRLLLDIPRLAHGVAKPFLKNMHLFFILVLFMLREGVILFLPHGLSVLRGNNG